MDGKSVMDQRIRVEISRRGRGGTYSTWWRTYVHTLKFHSSVPLLQRPFISPLTTFWKLGLYWRGKWRNGFGEEKWGTIVWYALYPSRPSLSLLSYVLICIYSSLISLIPFWFLLFFSYNTVSRGGGGDDRRREGGDRAAPPMRTEFKVRTYVLFICQCIF